MAQHSEQKAQILGNSMESPRPPRKANEHFKPRSVYVAPHALTRELSDLSGSYANGATNRSLKSSHHGSVFGEQAPGSGPWSLAYVLSRTPPMTRQEGRSSTHSNGRNPTIVLDASQSVELIDAKEKRSVVINGLGSQGHNRIPVNVLLMDGVKHRYEILQIWIDRSIDSVRDMSQAIQQGIPEAWKLAYDGIFQVRGNRFTQLIHILRLAKYDIQPNEILIAKPWSVPARVTIAFATSAIRHLTNVGIVDTEKEDMYGRGVFRPKSEDTPLILSMSALERIYVPNGISSDHHAIQFLSFSPPFESARLKLEDSEGDGTSSVGSRVSSLGGSWATFNQKKSLIDGYHKSNTGVGVIDEDPSAESANQLEMQSAHATPARSSGNFAETQQNSVSLMGQLNCCRVKNVTAITCCTPNNALGASNSPCTPKSIYPPIAGLPTNELPRYHVHHFGERAPEVLRSMSPPATSNMPAPNLSGIKLKTSNLPKHTSRYRRHRRTQTIEL